MTQASAIGGSRIAPTGLVAQVAAFYLFEKMDLTIAKAGTAKLPMLRDLSDEERAIIVTIVSELGSNILKYASPGTLRVTRVTHADAVDIEIQAEDRGPGIPDMALAMSEHYSTGGTLGLGLPGVQRMAHEFRLKSDVGVGTTVFARRRIHGRESMPEPGYRPPMATGCSGAWDVNASVRPHPHYDCSGDAALVIECEGGVLLAIIDATGHGPRAGSAADTAVSLVRQEAGQDLFRLMTALHAALQGSQGAAVGLIFVDLRTRIFRYLAVGNTRAVRIGGRPWRGVSHEGVLGDRLPSFPEQTERLDPGDVLMLSTDGLPGRESERMASSLSYRDAAVITRRVLGDLAKPHDDASCVVFKWLK